MRNLKLMYTLTHKLRLEGVRFITCSDDGSFLNKLFLCTEKELISYDMVTEVIDHISEVEEPVSCEMVLDNLVCVALKKGQVILYDRTAAFEDVMFCEDGIAKMSWSPDLEVGVIVTANETEPSVLVVSSTFEIMSEVFLKDDQFGKNSFINVGWGKTETQFHGKEGKKGNLAHTEIGDSAIPSDVDFRPDDINITWRADGELFAVSFVGQQGRNFKVFSKQGALQYTSEQLTGLTSVIAWRPSGTWIAVPQQLPNKSTIALFEKNGLRHREIVLPFQLRDEPILHLGWSNDSDILSVHTVVEGKSRIYFYTIGNYHWYLKQTIYFDSIQLTLAWDTRSGYDKTFYSISSDGTISVYSWIYTVDLSSNGTMVGVIDGDKLLLTDFNVGLVPPPMSTNVIKCDTWINICVLRGTEVALVTALGEVQIFDISFEPRLARRLDVWKGTSSYLHNFVWPLNGTKICCVQSGIQTSDIIEYSFVYKKELSRITVPGTVCSLEMTEDKRRFIVHTTNGNISVLDGASRENLASIGDSCTRVQGFCVNQVDSVASLDKHRILRINAKQIATDVTSFHLTSKYLVFTQLMAIKFLQLDNERIIDTRKIERGAKLVTIFPKDAKVILQLPRGNLELIYPRVLALELVGDLLDNKQYKQAVELIRKQRINMNIICDHDLKNFTQNFNKFLGDTSPQWLNLFFTDLQNEDVTLGMYKSNYPNDKRDYPNGFRLDNKIKYICDLGCEWMRTINAKYFRLPLITAQVKNGRTEDALRMIFDIRNNPDEGEKAADKALQYLLYLVDVNELYEIALSMYDLSFVFMVMKKSQKDPKEFLPFLNELKSLEENYMKYRIDVHFKRYSKALEHLFRCGESHFEETFQFIQQHKLYKDALKLYPRHSEQYKKIAQVYGDYLQETKEFASASWAYERSGDLKKAIMCSRIILDWERCTYLTKLTGIYPQDIAMSMVPALMDADKYEDAYEILKRYGTNIIDGILCLIEGNFYLKAIFEATLNATELISTIITPNLLQYTNLLLSNINEDRNLFLAYKERLSTVRKSKIKQQTQDSFEDNLQNDESDLISDTSSVRSSKYSLSSRTTGKTFRSSKNRRKHERKVLSLKEGNPFEDIALIDALYNHVTKVYGIQATIRDACKALLAIYEDSEARELQATYKDLLQIMRHALDEIWTPEVANTGPTLIGPNIDYAAVQNELRYSMLDSLKRFKPQLPQLDWEHEILK